jgi:hypothetical protein
VRNGDDIDAWKDTWVPWLPDFKPRPRCAELGTMPLKVSSLIRENRRKWDPLKLYYYMGRESADSIFQIPTTLVPKAYQFSVGSW